MSDQRGGAESPLPPAGPSVVDNIGERALDPLGDAETAAASGGKHNYAKVGSGRPSSLLYTYGPGAIMDLPHFTVMPSGLDDWERIWKRRDGVPTIAAPALLEAVRTLLRHRVTELRPFPHQPDTTQFDSIGRDLGVPARVFPQWMRCTGCDRLAPISSFTYRNTNPYQPHEAIFEHAQCSGRQGGGPPRKNRRQPTVTARYLITCEDGHLDEFPYDWFVHEGARCPDADAPVLKMEDRVGGQGASAVIKCDSCGANRPMNTVQGEVGRDKLPSCRGRHPHLDGFTPSGCTKRPRLILVGASNLWFPALTSAVVMPRLDPAQIERDLVDELRRAVGAKLPKYVGNPDFLRDRLEDNAEFAGKSDDELEELIQLALADEPSEEEKQERFEQWDPTDLLVPEWNYLLRDPASDYHADERSGLTLSPRARSPHLPAGISRVLAIDRLRRVNALVGFTRVDDMDRVNDLGRRLVPLNRNAAPDWIPATEDRGEGLFLQFDEGAVAAWEEHVVTTETWLAHVHAHERNFYNRFSDTAADIDPALRLPPPRYWLIHTFSHVVLRQMAMSSGYGAASISERLYSWSGTDGGRPPAAGLLLCTTASDSDGTLGGLVRLSEPDLLANLIRASLAHARRCSSDPVCAGRTPRDPEDFLHGAACHGCTMASETSCERANRFLDRRFLVPLPGAETGLAFFGDLSAG